MESLPKQNQCKNMTQSEASLYLSEVISLLEANKQSTDSGLFYELILRISKSYYDYYNKFISEICNLFIKRNICQLLCYYLKNVTISNFVKDKIVTIIQNILINFSDHSDDFAKSVLSSDILHSLVDAFFFVDSSGDINDPETKKFLYRSVVIINNIARNLCNNINYRIPGIINALERYIKLNCDDELELISILTLSYLVEESQVGQLDEGLGIIKNLIKHIRYINDTNERSNGFTLKELVHGLRCISCNDNMKIRIDEEGGIPILINIIRINEEDVVESALGTIENLCFNEKIKQKLKDEYTIEEIIKPFENSHCEKIRRNYNGILWKVQNKAESFHKTETQKKCSNHKYSFDVFLSYAWANKANIRQIFQKLSSYKFRVWIDEEQMKDSSIEAMANGIENSRLFILASSSSYRKSENCRREAEYAFQIKKPIIPIVVEMRYKPSSWLGFIMGTKVYYEFSERRDTEIEIIKLRKSIQLNLENDISEEEDEVKKEENKEIDEYQYSDTKLIENWSTRDVSKWLEDCQMGYLKTHLEGVDGRLLQIMIDMRLKSADYFNKSLRNEFGMKFLDVVKFHKALNDLNLLN